MNWFLHVLKNYFDESLMITVVVFVFLINFRAHSENEGTSLPSADSCTSPTKIDSSYNKTAKQCLEEISGKCAADWCKSQTWSFFCNLLDSLFYQVMFALWFFSKRDSVYFMPQSFSDICLFWWEWSYVALKRVRRVVVLSEPGSGICFKSFASRELLWLVE